MILIKLECVKINKKFTDDTKVGHIVMNHTDSENLKHLSIICPVVVDLWGMRFNTDKCKVIHVGKFCNNQVLSKTEKEILE